MVEATGGDATDVAEEDEAGVLTVAETEVDRQASRGDVDEEWDWLNAEPEDVAGSVDDPVSIYLREIGRVELLTAQEERALAREKELAGHLRELESELEQGLADAAADDLACGGEDENAAWEAAMLLLARIARSTVVARVVARHLGLDDALTLDEVRTHPALRAAIDGKLDPELVDAAARELDLTEDDARARRRPFAGYEVVACRGGGNHGRLRVRLGGAVSRRSGASRYRGRPVHAGAARRNAGRPGAQPAHGDGG